MTAPDPTAHSETPDQQTAPGPQSARGAQDSPGGRVGGAVHAALAARLVLPAIGLALAGTILGVASPEIIAWMIVVPAAIVFIVWKKPWRQSLGLRGFAFAGIFGILFVGYLRCMFVAMNHLPVGTVVVFLMSPNLCVFAIYGLGKRRFFGLALAFVGLAAFAGQAFLSVGIGDVRDGVVASLSAGIFSLGATVAHNVAAHFGYDRSAFSGVGLATAAILFGLHGAPVVDMPALTGHFIAISIVVSLLMVIIPGLLSRNVAQRAGRRTEGRYNVFYPAAAMLAGVVLLGPVPSLLDLLGLALITGALWIMSGVTIVPRRFFRKRGPGEVTAD